MFVRLPTPAVVVLEAAEAEVAAAPSAAVAVVGIGRLKASKNAGVPKVSVRAMARTCHSVSDCQYDQIRAGSYSFSECSKPVS